MIAACDAVRVLRSLSTWPIAVVASAVVVSFAWVLVTYRKHDDPFYRHQERMSGKRND